MMPSHEMYPLIICWKPTRPKFWKFWRFPEYLRDMKRFNDSQSNNLFKAFSILERISEGADFRIRLLPDTGGGQRIAVHITLKH